MKANLTEELITQLHAECLAPVAPCAIDPFTDSTKVRAIYDAFVEAFPDGRFAPAWRVVERNRAVLGGTVAGTHLGTWLGVPASGKHIEVLATLMVEYDGDRVVDINVVPDTLSIAVQIGVVPPLGPKACELVAAQPTGGPIDPRRTKWC